MHNKSRNQQVKCTSAQIWCGISELGSDGPSLHEEFHDPKVVVPAGPHPLDGECGLKRVGTS